MKTSKGLSANQAIMLAALDLANAGSVEFTEWDLTVAVWKRDPNKFGCRGYEADYPDHKRVMMEIMHSKKKDNPLRKGWLERTRANHYRITELGRAEAERVQDHLAGGSQSHRSPQTIYDAVATLVRNPAYQKHKKDEAEPRLWMGAASFLQLTSPDPQHLEDRLVATRATIANALRWIEDSGSHGIRRGASGGGEEIREEEVLRLRDFLKLLETRFANQIGAIRSVRV